MQLKIDMPSGDAPGAVSTANGEVIFVFNDDLVDFGKRSVVGLRTGEIAVTQIKQLDTKVTGTQLDNIAKDVTSHSGALIELDNKINTTLAAVANNQSVHEQAINTVTTRHANKADMKAIEAKTDATWQQIETLRKSFQQAIDASNTHHTTQLIEAVGVILADSKANKERNDKADAEELKEIRAFTTRFEAFIDKLTEGASPKAAAMDYRVPK